MIEYFPSLIAFKVDAYLFNTLTSQEFLKYMYVEYFLVEVYDNGVDVTYKYRNEWTDCSKIRFLNGMLSMLWLGVG